MNRPGRILTIVICGIAMGGSSSAGQSQFRSRLGVGEANSLKCLKALRRFDKTVDRDIAHNRQPQAEGILKACDVYNSTGMRQVAEHLDFGKALVFMSAVGPLNP